MAYKGIKSDYGSFHQTVLWRFEEVDRFEIHLRNILKENSSALCEGGLKCQIHKLYNCIYYFTINTKIAKTNLQTLSTSHLVER